MKRNDRVPKKILRRREALIPYQERYRYAQIVQQRLIDMSNELINYYCIFEVQTQLDRFIKVSADPINNIMIWFDFVERHIHQKKELITAAHINLNRCLYKLENCQIEYLEYIQSFDSSKQTRRNIFMSHIPTQQTVPPNSSDDDMFFKGCRTREDIDKRYKQLIKIYHPDNNTGDNEITLKIKKNYEELMEKLKKKC